jgi:hypothetical protein
MGWWLWCEQNHIGLQDSRCLNKAEEKHFTRMFAKMYGYLTAVKRIHIKGAKSEGHFSLISYPEARLKLRTTFGI